MLRLLLKLLCEGKSHLIVCEGRVTRCAYIRSIGRGGPCGVMGRRESILQISSDGHVLTIWGTLLYHTGACFSRHIFLIRNVVGYGANANSFHPNSSRGMNKTLSSQEDQSIKAYADCDGDIYPYEPVCWSFRCVICVSPLPHMLQVETREDYWRM